MWPSYRRAVMYAPPSSLRELQPSTPGTSTVLFCTLPGCPACKRFKAEKPAFESKHFSAAERQSMIPWNCGEEDKKKVALEAGVSDIPAYVVLAYGKKPRLIQPP